MSNQRKVLSKNIKNLIDSKKIDQRVLADYLDLSEMAVSSWVNGSKYPRMGNIQKMADYFGVMKSDIIEGGVGQPFNTSSEYPHYPNSISAGSPLNVEAITQEDKISIPDALMGRHAGQSDIFITRINGNSMDKVMPDQSLIAVKPIEIDRLKNDDIVVYSDNHEYGVKRFYKQGNEIFFRPRSTDFSHRDNVYSLDNTDGLEIHGKVVLYIVETD